MNGTDYGYITPENLSLFTDLNELTMMQGYFHQNHNPTATFDLFFRDLPPDRGYMLAVGLEQAIHSSRRCRSGTERSTILQSTDSKRSFCRNSKRWSLPVTFGHFPRGNPSSPTNRYWR